MTEDWLNWQVLEQSLPLDELPAFHRAFLNHNRPDEENWDEAFLRRIQGKVQATLKALERKGLAKTEKGILWIAQAALPEAYRHGK
ncbi:MAG: hypothetical protein KC422_03280 [Trueperaceae bacterium]|nr:hypothetical protein [Trueperaceae bacterium]